MTAEFNACPVEGTYDDNDVSAHDVSTSFLSLLVTCSFKVVKTKNLQLFPSHLNLTLQLHDSNS